MSTHVVVIASDLRRATVKVTSGTYLVDVLQEACKKLGVSSDRYLLKHKQKQVDLTVPFRASGLVGGAKLELVQKSKTPSAVQIGLQLPHPEAKDVPGGRLIKKFPSDLTLWAVLRQFESGDASAGRNINITARGVARTSSGAVGSGSGQLYYETPVLNIMGRDYATFADFQKTLTQLGHNSGSVLIRLTFKTTEQTLFEAMQEIGQYFKETAPQEESRPTAVTAEEGPAAVAQSADSLMPDAVLTETEQAVPEAEGQLQPSQDTTKDPYEPVSVFLAPSSGTPAAALVRSDDSDFTPTIAHAKLHQGQLQENARNKRLLSDKELEQKAAEEQARVAAIKSVLVKIRFPDNTSSDWEIDHGSTGAFLYEAVRHVMASPALPFHLVLPGTATSSSNSRPQVVKDNAGPKHNLIGGYRLHGRVLINLVWDDDVSPAERKQPFLKANVAKQGQAIKVPDMPESQPEEKPKSLAPPKENTEEPKDKGPKVPKWLKLGKK